MDREPQIRGWLALAVFALLVGLLIGAALGVRRTEPAARPEPVLAEQPAPPPEPAPAAPPEPPVLKRGDLLGAAARAAANYSSGMPYGEDQKALVGRRFELVTPVGCDGPTPTLSLDPAQVSVDPKAKTVVVEAQPRDWTQTAWVREIIGQREIEAAEGFWVPRPWQTSEACPAVPSPSPGEPPPTLAPPSVGVVQLLGPDDSRLAARASKPFRLVRKATDQELESRDVAARFLVSGRVSALSDGVAVRCRSSSVDQWPVCLIGVQIDRVAFLAPGGEVLAEWSLPAAGPAAKAAGGGG